MIIVIFWIRQMITQKVNINNNLKTEGSGSEKLYIVKGKRLVSLLEEAVQNSDFPLGVIARDGALHIRSLLLFAKWPGCIGVRETNQRR
jgi:hypothetical protein